MSRQAANKGSTLTTHLYIKNNPLPQKVPLRQLLLLGLAVLLKEELVSGYFVSLVGVDSQSKIVFLIG